MTPLQKQKVKALKKARSLVRSGETNWICRALTLVGGRNPSLYFATSEMKRYIQRELGGANALLSGWLHRNQRDVYEKSTSMDLRRFRLQWIDWMIRCLEGTEP